MPVSQSVSPTPAQSAKPSTAVKPGVRSPFHALFSDASPDPAPEKKNDDNGDAPISVPIFVPSPPKLLLPVALTPQGSQQAPSVSSNSTPGLTADLTLDTVELQQPLDTFKPPVEELAFAAKLVETAPQTPAETPAQTPAQIIAPISAADAQPVMPAMPPQPAEHKLTPPPRTQTEPDNPRQPASDASGHHLPKEPAITPIDPAPSTSLPASSSVTLRSVATTPQTPTIDHIVQRFERSLAAPLNEITLRVANADQTSASIRMIDRSGELRVAIRASDPQLADSLRSNVEQLTSRLNNNGWSAEVWRPAAVAPAVRTQSSSQEMSQGQPGPKHEQERFSDREQQNRKQKYPDWVEEFYANNQ